MDFEQNYHEMNASCYAEKNSYYINMKYIILNKCHKEIRPI